MLKFNEKQEARLQVIEERIEKIDKIIDDHIKNRSTEIPLNLVLEVRFLQLQQHGIELEASIAELDEEFDKDLIEMKNRRLDMVKGQLYELTNVGELLFSYHSLGRKFGIVEEKE